MTSIPEFLESEINALHFDGEEEEIYFPRRKENVQLSIKNITRFCYVCYT